MMSPSYEGRESERGGSGSDLEGSGMGLEGAGEASIFTGINLQTNQGTGTTSVQSPTWMKPFSDNPSAVSLNI
jgi:hypothetical protein